ncbi:MAG TPA: chorismate mutase [Acidobacteriota bacterium]
MKGIDGWRRAIDQADAELVEKLNQRARQVLAIGRLKAARGERIYDPEREEEILRRVMQLNRGPFDGESIRRLFERILDESRRLERLSTQGQDQPRAARKSKRSLRS